MRRFASDWLFLPLILLPLALGVGFCWVVRGAYDGRIAAARGAGGRLVRIWFESRRGDGGDLRAQFLEIHRAALRDHGPGVPFELGARSGRVLIPDEPRPDDGTPWVLGTDLPRGLPAGALVRPDVRLRVEAGDAVASIEPLSGPDGEFVRLLRNPDLDGLRAAVLPASSKAFLVRTWHRSGRDSEELRKAARILEALRALDLAELDDSPPGAHTNELGAVLDAGPGEPLLVWPAHAGPVALVAPTFALDDDSRDPIRLRWSAGPATGNVLWSGTPDDAPLAGTWSLEQRDGASWWTTPTMLRWGPVVLVLVLVLTAIPAFMWVGLRRQRALDAQRARFLNELAHDLRTPLTSLRLYAEMLATSDPPAEKRAKYTGVIARESSRLSELLANLLDLSRLEHGRRSFELEDVVVDRAVESAVRDFKALHPRRESDVAFEGPADVIVHADRAAFARCLANLLDNAGKFTSAGDGITVAWTADAGLVRIVVADDGPGIPPGEREHVFGRYRRGQQAQSDGVPGTGLGLSLVRELVLGMDGDVELAESARGARFVITLPGGNA